MSSRSKLTLSVIFLLALSFVSNLAFLWTGRGPTYELLCSKLSSVVTTGTDTAHGSPGGMSMADSIRSSSLSRRDAMCRDALHNDTSISVEWRRLCAANFTAIAEERLINDGSVHIVQIGAHVGFDDVDDPLAVGLRRFLSYFPEDARKHVHWTFVEPSPPTYKRLKERLENATNGATASTCCSTSAIQAAVVPDNSGYENGSATFYSFSDSIDPQTGFDSRSGKTLPAWITQVAALDMKPIVYNRGAFKKLGLWYKSYVVETEVTVKTYTELMTDIIMESSTKTVGDGDYDNADHGSSAAASIRPLLVLIDAEGYDCQIVESIPQESDFLPDFLIYEKHQCGWVNWNSTQPHLKHRLGYDVFEASNNAVAVRNNTRNRRGGS